MRKKYIVELESGTHIFILGPEGIVHIGEPDVVYETVNGMQIGDEVINAEPYTEPDLEQVKADAYNDGYKAGREAERVRQPDLERVRLEAEQLGMVRAWEAARRLLEMDLNTLHEIFGWVAGKRDIFIEYTAAEALEKIRQYEQEKEEIKTGDEVITRSGETIIVTCPFKNDDIDWLNGMGLDGRVYSFLEKNCIKTGKHYSEIAEFFQKMQEGREQ